MNEKKFDGADLQGLKRARDEARLQAHLFTAEMRTDWEKLETDWKTLKRSLKQEHPALTRSIDSVRHAAEPIVSDLRAAYDRLLKVQASRK